MVVAAGEGTRLGAALPKALVPLGGRPLVAWSLAALDRAPDVVDIVIVAPPGHVAPVAACAGDLTTRCRVIPGGASRAESVALGLVAADLAVPFVLVHDAARPLLTPEMVAAVLRGVGPHRGAILAAPVADTLKRVTGTTIERSTPRAGLWAAQTPQAFVADALRDAVGLARATGTLADATDCASLVEAAGGDVAVVDPGAPNLKVTTPADLELAAAILAARSGGTAVG